MLKDISIFIAVLGFAWGCYAESQHNEENMQLVANVNGQNYACWRLVEVGGGISRYVEGR